MANIGIIGSGPAGLMMADVASSAGHHVTVFERRNGPARKLFIAGSSGLNISNNSSFEEFLSSYEPKDFMRPVLEKFGVKEWLEFLHSLGLTTFLGTSGRYFVKPMNALALVRSWRAKLSKAGVSFVYNAECIDFNLAGGKISLSFTEGTNAVFDTVGFALGGGSYEGSPPSWPSLFNRKNSEVNAFSTSNVGFEVLWKNEFLKEAEGKPLKDVVFTTKRGSKQGDLVITSYGLEGTPVYTVGAPGNAYLDLKPTMGVDQIIARCNTFNENISPIRRIKKRLKLNDAALALLFHYSPKGCDLNTMVKLLKAFPLELAGTRPLTEAISSRGGLALKEIDANFMLRKYPGVYVAGEMLDWDAPTGGYLIQACVSQGFVAGTHMSQRG